MFYNLLEKGPAGAQGAQAGAGELPDPEASHGCAGCPRGCQETDQKRSHSRHPEADQTGSDLL